MWVRVPYGAAPVEKSREELRASLDEQIGIAAVKVCQQDDHDRVLGGNGQVGVDFTRARERVPVEQQLVENNPELLGYVGHYGRRDVEHSARRNSLSGVAVPVEALIHAFSGHWAMPDAVTTKKLSPRLARTRARSGRVEAGFNDERERERRERRDATHV